MAADPASTTLTTTSKSTTSTTTSSIADARRQAATAEILLLARQLIMERGLDVTMDEMADGVGVGRRTLFRHFVTRERLLAAALEAGIQRYGELLPTFSGEWRTWLRALCESAHRMQAAYGPGYWELTSRSDLAPDIAAVEDRRKVRRRQTMGRIARKLWTEAGGAGETPKRVSAAVGAHLSARFTAAVTVDVGQSWEVAAELAFTAIQSAVDDEVAASRRAEVTGTPSVLEVGSGRGATTNEARMR